MGVGKLMVLGMGGWLAANYLFVFMTAVSTASFDEPGIMRTPASHNMCTSSLKGRRANHLPTAEYISLT